MNNLQVFSLINVIKLNYKKKNLSCITPFSKKKFKFLQLFKKITLINKYYFFKKNNNLFIKIFLNYVFNNFNNFFFKTMTSSSKKIYVSVKSLKLLNKKTLSSIFIISTSRGLLTHNECIKKSISGFFVGLFLY